MIRIFFAIFFFFVLMVSPVHAAQTAAQRLLGVLQAAPSVTSKMLKTSDGKLLVTSNGKLLKTSGTDSVEKLLRTSDNKLLRTNDGKILKTP